MKQNITYHQKAQNKHDREVIISIIGFLVVVGCSMVFLIMKLNEYTFGNACPF